VTKCIGGARYRCCDAGTHSSVSSKIIWGALIFHLT